MRSQHPDLGGESTTNATPVTVNAMMSRTDDGESY